jgi:fatty acid desaturase
MQMPTEIAQDRPAAIEWPTLVLIAATYGALAALMWNFHALAMVAGGAAGLLSHRPARLAAARGAARASHAQRAPQRGPDFRQSQLLVPYRRYRKLHLIHHNDDNLTDPVLDPESYYLLPEDWARLPAPMKQLYTINNTLAGRMVLGPIIGTVRFGGGIFRPAARGDAEIAKAWRCMFRLAP